MHLVHTTEISIMHACIPCIPCILSVLHLQIHQALVNGTAACFPKLHISCGACMQAFKIQDKALMASTLAVDNIATVVFLSALFIIPASSPGLRVASQSQSLEDEASYLSNPHTPSQHSTGILFSEHMSILWLLEFHAWGVHSCILNSVQAQLPMFFGQLQDFWKHSCSFQLI
jgi:hypothetical protein